MLPYTPLHHLLFGDSAGLTADVSDGLSHCARDDQRQPERGADRDVDNQDARERLGAVADWFLVHNRDIYMRADDSVVRIFEGEERVMRRSRGYAPQTLDAAAASCRDCWPAAAN